MEQQLGEVRTWFNKKPGLEVWEQRKVKIDINGLQSIQISDNPFLEQQSKEKKIITSR